MAELPSTIGRSPIAPATCAGSHPDSRTIGRVAGFLIALSAIVGFLAVVLLTHRQVSTGFVVANMIGFSGGIVCVLLPWGSLSRKWLHVVAVFATIEIAVGIRLLGAYGDVASDYYVFVAVFVAYAFPTRWEVAMQVALAALASALPLAYRSHWGPHMAANEVVAVLMLVVIASVVTLLREGLQRRQRELEDLAIRDPLTGVGNYRLLTERLDYEVARHRRTAATLTVMLLDLDGFKEINDSFGHLVGDKLLIEVAGAINSVLRSQDTLARQGGDEFSILAPGTDEEQARGLAVRVQQAVSVATKGAVTTSVGWVTFPTHAADAATLLRLADEALLNAKQERGGSGRGRGISPHVGILHLVGGIAG
jgi:diguanylate cyclase